jgi:hypothetical protein
MFWTRRSRVKMLIAVPVDADVRVAGARPAGGGQRRVREVAQLVGRRTGEQDGGGAHAGGGPESQHRLHESTAIDHEKPRNRVMPVARIRQFC